MNTSGVGNPGSLLTANLPNAVGVWRPLVAGCSAGLVSFTLAAWLASDPAGDLAWLRLSRTPTLDTPDD